MNCPNCGAENQTGKFCAKCGAGLDVTCANCGASVPAGAKFCTSCGEAVGAAGTAPAAEGAGSGTGSGGGSGGGHTAAWVIAAASVIIAGILVVVFLPDSTRTSTAPATGSPPFMGSGQGAGGGMGGGTGGGMGGLSSDMRVNADRLFNRIMMAAQEGNEGEVAQFMPMAIQAYGMVDDLDADGYYHLGLLHLTAESYEEALSTARELLDEQPDHLLALAVAAEASEGLGQEAQADEYWRAYLDAYDSEAGRPIPEYVDHQPMLPTYRDRAQEAVGQ